MAKKLNLDKAAKKELTAPRLVTAPKEKPATDGRKKKEKPPRNIRAVFYIDQDDEIMLLEVQKFLRQKGERRDRSALVREAIRDLRKKYRPC